MAPDPDEDLRGRLRRALPAAMKARDAPAVTALRSALAAIDNAEAVDNPDRAEVAEAPPGAEAPPAGARPPAGEEAPAFAGTVPGVGAAEAERRRLTPAQAAEIVRAEVADRQAAADAYDRAGQAERADRLRTEARILGSYLEGAGS